MKPSRRRSNPSKVIGLPTIPGVSRRIAEVLIAECGVDMTQFPSAAHLGSWAGMCPGNNEFAGKHFSGRTRKGDPWLRGALGKVASSAARTKRTYLGARHRRLAKRRGKKGALVATGHSILISTWHMLANDVDYNDLGHDYFLTRIGDRRRRTGRLITELHSMGYRVTLEAAT